MLKFIVWLQISNVPTIANQNRLMSLRLYILLLPQKKTAGFLDFWRKLNNNNVRFIMVGGLATRFYGYNRNTDGYRMGLEDTPGNRLSLRKAFNQLNYGDLPSIETMQLFPGGRVFMRQV